MCSRVLIKSECEDLDRINRRILSVLVDELHCEISQWAAAPLLFIVSPVGIDQ